MGSARTRRTPEGTKSSLYKLTVPTQTEVSKVHTVRSGPKHESKEQKRCRDCTCSPAGRNQSAAGFLLLRHQTQTELSSETLAPRQELSPRWTVLPSACSRPAVHPDVSGTWTCICPVECLAASWLEHISCKSHAPLMMWLHLPAAPVPAAFVLYQRSNQITSVTKQKHIKGHSEAERLTWS